MKTPRTHNSSRPGRVQNGFKWEPPEFRDGAKPGTGGITLWWKFAPKAAVVRQPGGTGYGVRLSGGVAGVFGITNRGTRYGQNIAAHERRHVREHFKPAYTDYKRAVALFGKLRLTRAQARRLKRIAEGELAREFEARAIRDGTRHDWEDYGRDHADRETKRDRRQAMRQAEEDFAQAQAATEAALNTACLEVAGQRISST
jgi:hypothetical protein